MGSRASFSAVLEVNDEKKPERFEREWKFFQVNSLICLILIILQKEKIRYYKIKTGKYSKEAILLIWLLLYRLLS